MCSDNWSASPGGERCGSMFGTRRIAGVQGGNKGNEQEHCDPRRNPTQASARKAMHPMVDSETLLWAGFVTVGAAV